VKVLAWIDEAGWEAVVDAAAGVARGEVTLLHVAREDLVEAPAGALAGLIGRRRGEALTIHLSELLDEAGAELLDAAAARLGAPAGRLALRGRPEQAVLTAVAETGTDVLVLSRADGHPGPRSIAHDTRFVLDHAACAVLLVWPGEPPTDAPPPPPPKGKPKPKPGPKKPPPHH
jgi:hypothetical protein